MRLADYMRVLVIGGILEGVLAKTPSTVWPEPSSQHLDKTGERKDRTLHVMSKRYRTESAFW
jgi:hypothetical protein